MQGVLRGPVVRTLTRRAQIQSLVMELRTCMPHTVAKKKKIIMMQM